MTLSDKAALDAQAERAVMVCPQCEGEGGYPDGLDEAACHTECTRCGGNGWIVNLAALRAEPPADVAKLVEKWRDVAAFVAPMGTRFGEVRRNAAECLRDAADALAALSRRNAELEAEVEALRARVAEALHILQHCHDKQEKAEAILRKALGGKL